MSAEAIALLCIAVFAAGMLAYHLWLVGRIK